MIDVEPLIVEGLDQLTPAAAGVPDWRDVQRRAGFSSRRRRVVLAVIIASGVFVVAAVAATAFGGYTHWLTGEPGKPAPSAVQQRFAQETRSWSGFPRTTQLRQLVTAHSAGSTLTLYGFRGAGDLCLRLVATGRVASTSSACAPLALLRATNQPAWALSVDEPIGPGSLAGKGPFRYPVSPATVSFGITADDVDRVQVTRTDHSVSDAAVAGNAFLAVTKSPPALAQASRIIAYSNTGQTRIRFQPSTGQYGATPPAPLHATAPGPTTVQRVIHDGAIHWFAHRQLRGRRVPKSIHHINAVLPNAIFARLVTPDPAEPERIVISLRPAGTIYYSGRLANNRQLCAELVGGRYEHGGGCWPAGRVFSYAPFSWGVYTLTGGQSVVIAGLASDDVAAMKLFTAAGRATPIPIHDNAYFTLAGAGEYPLRIVAYDHDGHVIGIHNFNPPQSLPAGSVPLLSVTPTEVAHNSAGSVWTIKSRSGGRCYGFQTSLGPTSVTCAQPRITPKTMQLELSSSDPTSGRLFVTGQVGSSIKTVRVIYHDGSTTNLKPVHGFVIAELTRKQRTITGGIRELEGLNEDGKYVASESI